MMQPDELQLQEAKRLKSLAAMNIIDSGCDHRFDVFTKIAADIYHAPIALISLVEKERQWFKSAFGLPLSQTPIAWSFCKFAIQRPDEVFLVEDAALDPRFNANPLVTSEPNVRFYAGASLRSPSGEALGTLCILDQKTRSMTSENRRRLQGLAAGVSALIEMHRQNVEFRNAALTDTLTSLPNRRMFDEKLDIALAASFEGRPCSLVLLDLDGFKSINDTFGYQSGDMLLCEAASRIKSCVRSTDLLARLGGDEFAIIMIERTGLKEFKSLLARISEAFCTPIRLDEKQVSLQVSAGASHSPTDAQERGSLFRAAEMELHEAKRLKLARISSASASTTIDRRKFSQGKVLERELDQALRNKSIEVYWQPYFEIKTGCVRGFEALARWNLPGREAIPPTTFIPFAEERGLIGRLDAHVLEAACRQAANWDTSAKVSINISAHWFNGLNLAKHIQTLLDVVGLAPDRLCLEITERTVIASWETARPQIEKLRSMGISVALDDFGIGFSCLSYLRQASFNKLKLDRSFVRDLVVDDKAGLVAKSIIDLGHSLGMTVCGEGVETAAQLQTLMEMGCEYAQGFLLGRPLQIPVFTSNTGVNTSNCG